LLLYWAGERVDNHYIGYAAMQILVCAWILLGFGWKYLLALLFPWLFLFFLWPLIFLETYLAFPLRLVMSEVSVQVLNWIGIDAMKVGTAIVSAPDEIAGLKAGERFSVDVADPCSGIRSLFALMMVSALYGFFTFREWWKHLLIFLSSIPLAIAGNLFRILLLTVGTLVFGTEFAIGKGIDEPSAYHMIAGFFVFMVAIGGMLIIGWAMNFSWVEFFRGLMRMKKSGAGLSLDDGLNRDNAGEDVGKSLEGGKRKEKMTRRGEKDSY
ncbi:MAG: exosortase/archaeosortase family protein, partial [Chthoniobacterales bacterium]|nr:exosortase/archaeosortase family protein [Chthoniobacterales bacterium]